MLLLLLFLIASCSTTRPDEQPVLLPVPSCTPQAEECDNLDNDCDGVVDENLSYSYYSADPSTAEVGSCTYGIRDCWNGTWVWRKPEATPLPEFCDGIDNDCDGLTDEEPTKDSNQDCTPPNGNSCSIYKTVCLHYKTSCVELPGLQVDYCYNNKDDNCDGLIDNDCVTPEFEVCNGRDDDYDGLTDEPIEASEPCYGANPATLGVGACSQGIRLCVAGLLEETCRYQKTPELEFCDGIDNDCDGLTDEGFSSNPPVVDIVFVVDISMSMNDEIDQVKQSVASFADSYSINTGFQFALVRLATIASPYYDMPLNIASVDVFLSALASISLGSGGGIEPSYDALAAIAGPANVLGIHWRPGATRVVMLFGDEEGQTVAATTMHDVVQAASSTGTLLYIFTDFTSEYSGATVYSLSESTISVDVESTFLQLCAD